MKDIIKKALVYRLIIIVSQIIVLYILTGNITISTSSSLIFAVIATAIHVIFEKLWK